MTKNENLINTSTSSIKCGGEKLEKLIYIIDIPELGLCFCVWTTVRRKKGEILMWNAKLSISRLLQPHNGCKSTLLPHSIEQPFNIHHLYADREWESIRVLYRNQGFLPHKWATIVAFPRLGSISHRQHHNSIFDMTWNWVREEKIEFLSKNKFYPQNLLCFSEVLLQALGKIELNERKRGKIWNKREKIVVITCCCIRIKITLPNGTSGRKN